MLQLLIQVVYSYSINVVVSRSIYIIEIYRKKTYLKHKKKRIGQCLSLWVRADFFLPFLLQWKHSFCCTDICSQYLIITKRNNYIKYCVDLCPQSYIGQIEKGSPHNLLWPFCKSNGSLLKTTFKLNLK